MIFPERHAPQKVEFPSRQNGTEGLYDCEFACLVILKAEMKFKDKWMACISFGEQTFRTEVSDQLSNPWLINLSLLSRCFAWSTVVELDSITNLLHTE